MTEDGALVISLIVFTFAVVLVLAVVQWRKARRAREHHVHSSVGESPRTAETSATPPQPIRR